METDCKLKALCVWLAIVIAGAAVCHFSEEPQASAENPHQEEVIRSLVQDRESGTYSLRSVAEE